MFSFEIDTKVLKFPEWLARMRMYITFSKYMMSGKGCRGRRNSERAASQSMTRRPPTTCLPHVFFHPHIRLQTDEVAKVNLTALKSGSFKRAYASSLFQASAHHAHLTDTTSQNVGMLVQAIVKACTQVV